MCMCSASYCLGDFDNAATSCPIKCMNTTDSPDKKINTNLKIECTSVYIKTEPGSVSGSASNQSGQQKTGKRYKFSGVPKECQCPICQCKCNFACVVSDVPKIMQKRRLDTQFQHKLMKQGQNELDYETSGPGFLHSIMGDAIKTGFRAMKAEGKNMCMPRYKTKINENEEMYIENRGVTAACEEAATSIICKASLCTTLRRQIEK